MTIVTQAFQTEVVCVQPFMSIWRSSMIARNLSDRTIESYIDLVEKFIRHLGGDKATVEDISYKSIQSYIRMYADSHAARSVGLAITSIRSFCNLLIDLELRPDDPTARIRYPKIPKSLPKALPPHQVRELMIALNAMPDGLPSNEEFYWKRNRLAILIMLYAGLRLGEVAVLQWWNINFDYRTITVRGAKGKKDRTVPLHKLLIDELTGFGVKPDKWPVCGIYRGRKRLTRESWQHVFERWVPENLGLSYSFTSHQLRHTFATTMIHNGKNVFDVQILLGHEDPKTTTQYYSLVAEHLREAVDSLPSDW